MKPAGNTVLLELPVPDFELVKEYYGKLGFKVMRQTEPDEKNGYLILKMENNNAELAGMLKTSPEPKRCYELKETFRDSFNQNLTIKVAEKRLLRWIAQVDVMPFKCPEVVCRHVAKLVGANPELL